MAVVSGANEIAVKLFRKTGRVVAESGSAAGEQTDIWFHRLGVDPAVCRTCSVTRR